jgi:hypothetical protein
MQGKARAAEVKLSPKSTPISISSAWRCNVTEIRYDPIRSTRYSSAPSGMIFPEWSVLLVQSSDRKVIYISPLIGSWHISYHILFVYSIASHLHLCHAAAYLFISIYTPSLIHLESLTDRDPPTRDGIRIAK